MSDQLFFIDTENCLQAGDVVLANLHIVIVRLLWWIWPWHIGSVEVVRTFPVLQSYNDSLLILEPEFGQGLVGIGTGGFVELPLLEELDLMVEGGWALFLCDYSDELLQ
jgi:hypothetical protein